MPPALSETLTLQACCMEKGLERIFACDRITSQLGGVVMAIFVYQMDYLRGGAHLCFSHDEVLHIFSFKVVMI